MRGDGAVVWVSASVTAVLDADDRPTAAIAIVLDVSDRRHTEQALRESEERLRLIVDNAREYAILTLDLKRRITGWNSGAESLLGYVADEVDRRERRHHLHRGGPRRRRAAARGRAGARPRAAPPTSAGTAGRTARASGAAA